MDFFVVAFKPENLWAFIFTTFASLFHLEINILPSDLNNVYTEENLQS